MKTMKILSSRQVIQPMSENGQCYLDMRDSKEYMFLVLSGHGQSERLMSGHGQCCLDMRSSKDYMFLGLSRHTCGHDQVSKHH